MKQKRSGTSRHRTDPNRKAPVSLARALSKFGFCSRSQALVLIKDRRVSVNGRICTQPSARVDLNRDRFQVDGKSVLGAAKVYIMINKPRGLVTTRKDEQGRENVYSIFQDADLPWLFPVGRLDKASEGLLFFTNDTRWAARLMDPESHLYRVYHVQVRKILDESHLRRLLEGIENGGEVLKARKARLLRKGGQNCWLEIHLDEGRNRQIRRMFEGLGIEILRIIRIAIGPCKLGDLEKGHYRFLTRSELDSLSASRIET